MPSQRHLEKAKKAKQRQASLGKRMVSQAKSRLPALEELMLS
jgi:hypothetical protein